jgi:DSF synthase
MNSTIQSKISFIDPAAAEQAATSNTQILTQYEEKYQLHWCYMKPQPRPCFTPEMVEEISQLYQRLSHAPRSTQIHPIRYQVMASDIAGVFNLGGDLEMFKTLVVTKDRAALTQYAHTCVETMHAIATLHEKGITQITLVQGDALGGGLEMALAADVLIAEKSAKAGFPDIIFNSFPGIGAYTFLSRKIGTSMAERMILSGKLYSAEELHAMGVVDILAEDGQGEMAVYNYIAKENRCENAIQSIRKIRNLHNPLKYEQLLAVADLWVENAMQLNTRDIRMIERIISKQNHISTSAA